MKLRRLGPGQQTAFGCAGFEHCNSGYMRWMLFEWAVKSNTYSFHTHAYTHSVYRPYNHVYTKTLQPRGSELDGSMFSSKFESQSCI